MSPKRPEDEMDEMEGQEEPQEEVVVQGKQGWLANAPWWLISVGIHAVLILGATLIIPQGSISAYPARRAGDEGRESRRGIRP